MTMQGAQYESRGAEGKARTKLVRQAATVEDEGQDDKNTKHDRERRNSKRKEEVTNPGPSSYDDISKYSQTENIIYTETIDISPCSYSSRDEAGAVANKIPTQNSILKSAKQGGHYGSPRYLPKQCSAASSSSALLSIHTSPSSSLSGPLLVRGKSCSLVDIPTYLASSVELGTVASTNTGPSNTVSMENMLRLKQKIMQERAREKPRKRTECTLLCIALSFLLVCIAMVGTMLSYTTHYQDRAIARAMFYNSNTSHSNTSTILSMAGEQ